MVSWAPGGSEVEDAEAKPGVISTYSLQVCHPYSQRIGWDNSLKMQYTGKRVAVLKLPPRLCGFRFRVFSEAEV